MTYQQALHEAHKARMSRMYQSGRKPVPAAPQAQETRIPVLPPERKSDPRDALKHFRLSIIVKMTARIGAIKLADLTGPSKEYAVVAWRHAGMIVARKATTASLPRIVRAFGRSDHSTVVHALGKSEELSEHVAAIEAALDRMAAMTEAA